MKPIVYVDVLFLLNFFMNTVTIYISSLLIRQNLKIWRLLICAVFLSLYACIVFFPNISFLYSVIGKVFVLLLATYLGFSPKGLWELFKGTAILFAVTAILGGTIFTLIFATDFGTVTGSAVSNGEFYINVNPSTLILSIFLAYTCVYIISFIKKQATINSRQILDIVIHFQAKKISLKALLDTGCTLCDPISGSPAIIINKHDAKKLLPQSFFDFCDEKDGVKIPTNYLVRYRTLPFSTIDSKKGFLHGFIPDLVFVNNKVIKKSIIGISDYRLSPESDFDAILGPLILCEESIPLERTDVK
ncbi:MAG: sigma-E processing peptidase SpoIIGA [Clostridia bacterium]|nr:sigma-E processing peptidase SpoIIGA [Clostridia bacterium]